MKFSNLDVIVVTWIHHAHNHFEMYGKLKILRKAQFAKSYCINIHELLETYIGDFLRDTFRERVGRNYCLIGRTSIGVI